VALDAPRAAVQAGPVESVDLRTELKHLYQPRSGRFELVDVPELTYLSIYGVIEPGHGPSDSPGFEVNLGALYGLAYTVKFGMKKRAVDPFEFPVMPLEGQWSLTGGEFDIARPDNWDYRLLIVVPDRIGPDDVAVALAQLRTKRGDLPEFAGLRLERFAEGRCAQVMHVGPYATEPQTLGGLPGFLSEQGLVDLVGPAGGRHHEIYLGDPRRAAPDKLRTILRHPVSAA
jgi:hypothetical protein